ncbi:transcription factor subunit Med10 of mediator complex-domain-containing protein [Paraphysoderma sedebokerense]|nr:transcription factor subunit Med10 of mediator complex-domain-containing protein [Paraphysoderma sedebokerense]
MSEPRNQLELKLKDIVETLFELAITAFDFQPDSSQSLIFERMNKYISQLQSLQELQEQLDMHIPFDVLRYIEDARNPDIFTKEFVERTAAENQFTNGKVEAFKDFRAVLETEIEQAFPEQMRQYKQCKGSNCNIEETSVTEVKMEQD